MTPLKLTPVVTITREETKDGMFFVARMHNDTHQIECYARHPSTAYAFALRECADIILRETSGLVCL